MTQKEKRLEYFKLQRDAKNILKLRNTENYLEITCRNNGKIVVYKVYENPEERDGFFILYERTIRSNKK